jgi:predicted ATP-grasp superfamily ATP-dependent carboligase
VRIFFYEFITGGGMYSLPDSPLPSGSLLREGLAMRNAFAQDLLAAGHHVTLLQDNRLDQIEVAESDTLEVSSAYDERQQIQACASAADLTVVLAPEFDSLLLQRFDWCAKTGATILGRREYIEIASNKNLTAERLVAAGVPVVAGARIDDSTDIPDSLDFPLVLKQADGAGSLDIFLITDRTQLTELVSASHRQWRLERFQTGMPCSVAVIGNSKVDLPLVAATQEINSPDFTYLGGQIPLNSDWNTRARELATRAVRALGGTCGYTGVDLILSEEGDYVVDVNPRLTTSYVALRSAYRENLASAIIEIGLGGDSELSRTENEIEFDANGCVKIRNRSKD